MTIQIGRDAITNRLRLNCGTNSVLFGKADVPQSVLPHHCSLEIQSGNMRLQNISVNAYTFVNGIPVERKQVNHHDCIALGSDRYVFNWQALDQLLPPQADIRLLRKVWEHYDGQRTELQIAERKFNTLRSATGLITMAAIVLGFLTGRQSIWLIVLYVAAIVISLVFLIKAYKNAAETPMKQKQLEARFQHDYVCPRCGHFLGNQSYNVMSQNVQCPYCRVQFIH